MWYLTSSSDPRVIYVLPGKDITVGRSADGQNCNFAVPEDPSLSRRHANLSTQDNKLILLDLGSKYGTFINFSKDKLESNQNITLKVDDVIKFGKMNCEWKVQTINFVTCTSTLKGENIQNLKIILDELGGTLKSEWDDSCAYLTMPAITLTIKVVLALVQGSYIVTPDYWKKCLEAISQGAELPNPDHFIPQIVESTINKDSVSFHPNRERKSLFCGKSVIFFSKRQLEMYRMALERSSATALLLSETKLTKAMLCSENVIVIQYNITSTSQDSETQKEQIKDIVNYLRSKGKRVVADAEIGLAILYCATDKYCNPDFNFTTEVIKQPSSKTTSSNNILAQESQNPPQPIAKKENIKIDESLSAKTDNSFISSGNDEIIIIGKRKLTEDEGISNVCKKIVIEATNCLNVNRGKRAADDSDLQTNPSKKVAVGNPADDDNSFNFIRNNNKKTENCEDHLNLMKPIKRKIEEQDDEDGLFNFVKKKAATEQNTDFGTKIDIEDDEDSAPQSEKINSISVIDNKVDITALRGAKLLELLELNSNMEVNNKIMKVVKTEDQDNEDFGTTVIVVRNDMIIKRETLPIKDETETSRLKNFKKFKKVWPLKIQASMSKLSLGVA